MPYKDLIKRREKGKEAMARWRARNPEKVLERGRIYDRSRYEKRKPFIRDYQREYQRKNKSMSRHYRLKHVYGITQDDYNSLFKKQNGQCSCCGRHQTDIGKVLCVEHNHKSGKVRGLVCHRCNLAIAVIENKEICLKVTLYLQSAGDS